MESQMIRGISLAARNSLCFDPFDEHYKCQTRRAKLVNVLLVLCTLRVSYFAIATRDEFWYFVLGHHFDAFGDAKLWSLMTGLVASLRVLVYVVVSHLTTRHPGSTIVVGHPMRKLMLQRRRWKSIVAVLNIVKCLVRLICFIPYMMEFVAVIILYPNASILEFGYQSLWSLTLPFVVYHYSLVFMPTTIFLTMTCVDIGGKFADIKQQLTCSVEDESVIGILENFHHTCANLSRLDFFWKRILFVVVTINMFILCLVVRLSVFITLPTPIAIAMNVCVVNLLVIFSCLLLAPAYVNSQSLKCYVLFCSKMFDVNYATRYMRFKLCHTLKRFSNPIAFSLWDTNTLDYMDYVNSMLTLATNFLLLTKLMIKGTSLLH